MNCAAVAIVFAIAQASSPISKTANRPAHAAKEAPAAQSPPVPTQSPVRSESQRSGTTTGTHTQTSSKGTSDEDRSTQRKLTWFTGVLAGVGVLQLLVMFLTWLVYRRQAHEMRRQ